MFKILEVFERVCENQRRGHGPSLPPLRTPMSPNSNPKPNQQLFLSLILALILTLTVFPKNRCFWAVLSAVWPNGKSIILTFLPLGYAADKLVLDSRLCLIALPEECLEVLKIA